MTTSHTRPARTPLQRAAVAVGIAFLLVGVLGFVPVNTADNGCTSSSASA